MAGHPRVGAAALAVATLAACSNEAIRMSSGYQPGPAARASVSATCRFQRIEFVDLRPPDASLGHVAYSPVSAENFIGWIRSGFAPLQQQDGVTISPLSARVELLKAHAHSVNISKAANIVVRVRYLRDGRETDNRIYRGADTSMNWASGIDETQAAFSRALDDLMVAVRQDLPAICGPVPPIAG